MPVHFDVQTAFALCAAAGWLAVAVRSHYQPKRRFGWFFEAFYAVGAINTAALAWTLTQDGMYAHEDLPALITIYSLLPYLLVTFLKVEYRLQAKDFGSTLGWASLLLGTVGAMLEVAIRSAPSQDVHAYQTICQILMVIGVGTAVGFAAYIAPEWGMRGMARPTDTP